jgi:membrane protein implicated in regulation of membrane protease activity
MLKGVDLSLVAYWVCFSLGAGYATVSAILGGFFGMVHHAGDGGALPADMGHDYGAGGHGAGGHGEAFGGPSEGEPVIAPLSPATISVFLTTFGGIGVITTTLFHLRLLLSLPISLASGLAVAGSVLLLFYHLFTKLQASSETRMAEVVGLTGEVTVAIPSDGIGEVAYVCRGARLVAPARAKGEGGLDRHARVRIAQHVGSTLYVEPASGDEGGPASVQDETVLKD